MKVSATAFLETVQVAALTNTDNCLLLCQLTVVGFVLTNGDQLSGLLLFSQADLQFCRPECLNFATILERHNQGPGIPNALEMPSSAAQQARVNQEPTQTDALCESANVDQNDR